MGFLYENSNPERFQHFCQALLTPAFPRLQCFPVAQPDGGRDGYDPETKTVLQVKFKRSGDEESADWMIGVLEKELPSIKNLIANGAELYLMATNALGTSHPGGGRIDRVQQWLDKNVSIPAQCLWRDDLDRRFERAPLSLKLKYAELLSLEDGLEVVFRELLGSGKQRQQDALRGFLAWQFDLDATVKFKQVSLSNSLLDLFIDVPLAIPPKLLKQMNHGARGPATEFLKSIRSDTPYNDSLFGSFDFTMPSHGLNGIAASALKTAQTLLGFAAQEHLKRVVLEGAPGQGKSTLAQYVCQIHRARFLGLVDVLKSVPDEYKQTAFRIPLKVDLRDLSTFLNGRDPFDADNTPIAGPHTFDRFLAWLIEQGSGGISFDAHDVLALMQDAPVLLFLDGLDEVPDIAHREKLVSAVGEALARWQSFDCDLQVVVTSRPSVFGHAPSFDKAGFVTLSLGNIDGPLISEYAEKWMSSRGLDLSEARAVRKILSEKLDLAHIRDLTRNPMQLTILLSLIHQIGHSLPDQRTDLYGRYVDLFLTREADKHPMVRDNRQVLVEFIQYLAWVLQSEAESSNSAGSISAGSLQDLARSYLSERGHPLDIADDLFGGGFERVYVLVERIEGLYEFEVQPLREYFCARHLYETTPSALRDERPRGDLAQRFEALAANPFWLNVCRFYAGSCTRGETSTLVMTLTEMIQTGDRTLSIHARRVALALLQDWVFSSVRFPQDQLIRAVFDDYGLYRFFSGELRELEQVELEADCGRDTLRDLLFAQLVDTKTGPYPRMQIAYVLALNDGPSLQSQFESLIEESEGHRRSALISWMLRANAAESISGPRLWELVTGDAPGREILLPRIRQVADSRTRVALSIPELVSTYLEAVLRAQIHGGGTFSPLGLLAELVNHSVDVGHFARQYAMTSRIFDRDGDRIVLPTGIPKEFEVFVNRVAQTEGHGTDFERIAVESPSTWSTVAEALRDQFGDSAASVSLAVRAAGLPTKVSLPPGSENMLDSGVTVCARARYARLKRGGPTWWLDQRSMIASSEDRLLWLSLSILWASLENVTILAPVLNEEVEKLTDDEFSSLRSIVHATVSQVNVREDRRRAERFDLAPFHDRIALLLIEVLRESVDAPHLSTQQKGSPELVSRLDSVRLIQKLEQGPDGKSQESELKWGREVHAARLGSTLDLAGRMFTPRLNREVVAAILDEPLAFPYEWVSLARTKAQKRYRPRGLTSTAKEQDWHFV